MDNPITTFDDLAAEYDTSMGNEGDYNHQHTIDKALFTLVGEVHQKTIYDMACGNGYVARRFIREGAKEVLASDISQKLVEIARTKYNSGGITYTCNAAEEFSKIPQNYFDIVTMNMGIQYVKDLDALFAGVRDTLKDKGRFIFTCDHPLRNVARVAMGTKLDLPTEYESYLNQAEKTEDNKWDSNIELSMYRRPFGEYINSLAKHGLLVSGICEQPTDVLHHGEVVKTNIPWKMAIASIKTR